MVEVAVTAKAGVYVDARTLRFERRLPGTLEQVWAFLVEPERLAVWLARGEIEPHVGGQVVIHHEENWPKAPPARGVVTAWDPPRRLAYTWSESSTNSEVEFELSPAQGGVTLVLTHRHLPLGEEVGFGSGWHVSLNALALGLSGAPAAEIKAALADTPELDKAYAAALAEVEARNPSSPADDLRAVFEASAWHKHVGFELVDISHERLSARVTVRPELIGGRGTLHGGVVAALVESIGAFHAAAAARRYMQASGDEGDKKRPFRVAALDHHLDYLRPLIGKSFIASTSVLHTGAQLVRIRVDVVSDAGELVATANANYRY
jgi:uncharacterized protein (TIGR00369 family)